RLVLTAHHILWDGWSTSILVRELLTRYAGGELPPTTPFERYLSWLARQDRDAAHRAWSTALAGGRRPTILPPGLTSGARQEQLRADLGAAETAALAGWLRSHGITMNTAVQAAWGRVLADLTGSEDVVFGSSVSGRPPEVPGIGNVVGLLTNTIAVRVRF